MNFNDWSEELTKNFKQADDVVKQILKMAGNDNRFTPDSEALKSVVESMVEAQLKSFGIPSKKAHEKLLQQLLEAQSENEMLWKRVKVLEDKLAAQSGPVEPEAFKPAANRISKPTAVKKVSEASGVAKPIPKVTDNTKTTEKKKPAAKSTPDDLTQIKGIGPKLQERLVAAGIKTFAQLAALSTSEARKLDDQLELQGRILRDKWVSQAKALARKP